MNLQLFAGEKTEKATPRKRQEARKKGQVAKSNEIKTVLVLTLCLLMLQGWFPFIAREFQTIFLQSFSYLQKELTTDQAYLLILDALWATVKIVGPIILVAMIAGYVANVAQVGFLFTFEPLKLKLERIDPVEGFKRIFSKRSLAELIKSLIKTILIGYIAFSYMGSQLPALAVLMDYSIVSALVIIKDIAFTLAWRILLALFFLAILDYAYQQYEFEESLKMSKQEIKDEYKNIEGDPQLKAKIKERQRQMAMRRMMQEVPKATVVITNPTHFAIALRYEDGMAAPLVLAKGQDYVAQKIKELAQEHKIAVVENKPLARLLYEKVPIGGAIPEELYQAVAEVLAYVYRLKN